MTRIQETDRRGPNPPLKDNNTDKPARTPLHHTNLRQSSIETNPKALQLTEKPLSDEGQEQHHRERKNSVEKALKSEIVLEKRSKRSSPAFRIQVTVHRPLSWQLSSSSSSSIHSPRKYVRRSGSSPVRGLEEVTDRKNNDEEIPKTNSSRSLDAKRIPMTSTSASLVVSSRKGPSSASQTVFPHGNRNIGVGRTSIHSGPQMMSSNGNGIASGNKMEKNRLHRRRNQRVKRIEISSTSPAPANVNVKAANANANSITSSDDSDVSGSKIKISPPRLKRIKKRSSDKPGKGEGRKGTEERLVSNTASTGTLIASTNTTNTKSRSETEKENRNLGLKVVGGGQERERGRHQSSTLPKREVSIKIRSSRPSIQERRRKLEPTQSLDSPYRESHVSHSDFHPVMTWFKEPDSHVNKESGMGANGSTHSGRLKSRSQSSSAIYCIKPVGHNGNTNNGLVGGDPNHPGAYANGGGGGGGGGGVLSNSIPADLWDLPPTTKSYSPITRKHSRPHLEHQKSAEFPVQEITGKNHKTQKQHRAFPFMEALMHRSSGKRDGKKAKVRSSGGSGREKFFAVSCPDVAQQANGSIRGSSFSRSYVNAKNLDYGYTSERSHTFDCDDEHSAAKMQALINPSSTFSHPPAHYQMGSSHDQSRYYCDNSEYDGTKGPITFPFISEADIFEARLKRDYRGLGLSVTGGADSQESYPGLIRIKKVFPVGPAYESGRLRPWDIILKANGVPLTGLTNHEALEVLRTTPVETVLTVCRPPTTIPGFHIFEQSTNSQSQPQLSQFYPDQNQNQSQVPASFYQSHNELEDQQARQPPQHHSHHHQSDRALARDPSYSNTTSSSAFNPSVKSKSLSSLKIPSSQQHQHPSDLQHNYGEFEVTLEKIGGSLGFTLRQEDTSILGHYVRALVKDPALSDGRIQPGDRILSVNGQDLSGVSHADAISFLRQCPVQVTLRLYRDVAPTPISPLSPTESHKSIKTKPLRQEAIDMLNDLALRKQMSGSDPKCSLPGSAVGQTGLRGTKLVHDGNGPATLPRRRHQIPGVTPSPEVLSAALDRFAGRSTPKSNKSHSPESVKSNHIGPHNYPVETRSSGSGESTPAGTITQSRTKTKTDRSLHCNLSHRSSQFPQQQKQQQQHSQPKDSVSSDSSTDVEMPRKPSFRQYTLHLDRISSIEDESFSSDLNHTDSIVSEPGFGMSPTHSERGNNFRPGQPAYQSAILPSTGAKMGKKVKRHKDDADKCSAGRESPTTMSDMDVPSSKSLFSSSAINSQQMTSQTNQNQVSGAKGSKEVTGGAGGGSSSSSSSTSTKPSTSSKSKSGGLLKWKGIVFSQDNDNDDEDDRDRDDTNSIATSTLSLRDHPGSSNQSFTGDHRKKLWKRSSDDEDDYDDEDGAGTEHSESENNRKGLPQRRSPDGREFRDCDMMEISSSTTQCNGEQIFTVQLSRRWCSRLGFSLQGSEGHTFISAIYPDSVAAKDGRLRVGDEIIMINGETIRDVETTEVIDMMRKTRGMINITLLRKPRSPEPDLNSSDHQLGLT